ncbi:hypothetical protein L596_015011 [Steinernema carpocapsae]|uniref:RING-type domain-containing protein n=1 Tax=Steinernema carpocapsae TaxID=34508 RepID=A0A4U5NEM2_STECR|nr:hypothetical protein L596_015011 [Steinernema carpocapsae]
MACNNYFALVPRGNCSFSEKAYHAQKSSPIPFRALIIYNDPGQQPIPMSGGKYAEFVEIPVVMVNYACKASMEQYSAERGCVVKLKATPGYYDLIKYLIPFVAVVSFCFIVLLVSMIIRLCRERRRLARKRLSRSNLKKLPIKKYKKGDDPETCAICLEDFVEGEKLRVLPCRHVYHCKCIDPWLTKTRKVCPVCKRKVGPSNGSDSSDSENERRRATPSTSTPSTPSTSFNQRENAPLLSNELLVAHTSRVGTEDSMFVGSMVISPSNSRRGRNLAEEFQRLNSRNRNGSASGSTELLIENEYLENDEEQPEPPPSRFSTAIKATFAPILKVFSRDNRAANPRSIGTELHPEPIAAVDVENGHDGSENRGFDLRTETPGAASLPHTTVQAEVEHHAPPSGAESSDPPCERRRRHPAAQNNRPINHLVNTGLDVMHNDNEEAGDEDSETNDVPAQTYAPSTSKTVKPRRRRPAGSKRAPEEYGKGGALATSTHSVPANMVVNTFAVKENYKRPDFVTETIESDPPSPAQSPQDLLAGPMDEDVEEEPMQEGVLTLNLK